MKKIFVIYSVIQVLLSGCSTVAPDFNQMTAAYSATIDEHDRNSLLLNLLRSANSLPVQFTSIPSVIGTGTVITSAGVSKGISTVIDPSVGGFFTAAKSSSSSISAGFGTQRTFNFTLSTLDNSLFTQGFLSEITIDRLRLLSTSQEISKDLLYTMVVSSIDVNPQLKKNNRYINDMVGNNFVNFKSRMQFLVDVGLTTEQTQSRVPLGPPLTRLEAATMTNSLANLGLSLSTSGIRIAPVPSSKDQYQAFQTLPTTKYCISLPATASSLTDIFSPGARCTSEVSQENLQIPDFSLVKNYVNQSNKQLTFSLNIRSTRDIFRYMGQIINLQLKEGNSNLIKIRDVASDGKVSEVPLIVVRKGIPSKDIKVIARTNYFDEDYYIPQVDSGMSAEVINLLSVLVTLNKIPGSVPTSPGILIR